MNVDFFATVDFTDEEAFDVPAEEYGVLEKRSAVEADAVDAVAAVAAAATVFSVDTVFEAALVLVFAGVAFAVPTVFAVDTVLAGALVPGPTLVLAVEDVFLPAPVEEDAVFIVPAGLAVLDAAVFSAAAERVPDAERVPGVERAVPVVDLVVVFFVPVFAVPFSLFEL
ncbi:MAG: hypothetical protein IKP60_11680 [Treponema sp.]|nr:hypothetical protein [Treponema sp.]